jgi:glycosyltransferase involved in cell wall biosynthesis
MASGCALIAADQGAARELVEKSGGGVLVPYNDPTALAREANALLASGTLRERGQDAHAFAQRHFSWDAAFTRMLGFYQELAQAQTPDRLRDLPRRWTPA